LFANTISASASSTEQVQHQVQQDEGESCSQAFSTGADITGEGTYDLSQRMPVGQAGDDTATGTEGTPERMIFSQIKVVSHQKILDGSDHEDEEDENENDGENEEDGNEEDYEDGEYKPRTRHAQYRGGGGRVKRGGSSSGRGRSGKNGKSKVLQRTLTSHHNVQVQSSSSSFSASSSRPLDGGSIRRGKRSREHVGDDRHAGGGGRKRKTKQPTQPKQAFQLKNKKKPEKKTTDMLDYFQPSQSQASQPSPEY
jgi:hypothetical protein